MIKRLFFKSVIMLAIIIGAGAYVGYINGVDVTAMTGKLLQFAKLGDFNLETMRIESETVEDNARVLQAGKQRVYKWQDQSGQWHYTQIRPPAHARAVESIDVDPKTNVIAGFEAPQEEPQPDAEQQVITTSQQPQPQMPELENPYSPENIKQLFENAQNLQETLSKRYETQQQLMQGGRQ